MKERSGMRRISVIIPTYNRRETLLRCLRQYERQTFPLDRFEVIVVDDGSTDGTWEMLVELRGKLRYRLSCFWKENAGPGTSRNLGIRNATGEVLLIIGDDILPDDALLSEHHAWHTDLHPEDERGVLGFVTWDSDPPPSPFMIWLERGYQNAYHLIRHGEEVPWRFTYTGNISVKRAFLETACELFDERMPPYGFEDIEWGFRLHKKGLRLFHNRDAIGYHRHRLTLEDSLRRTRKAGQSARVLRDLNKEVHDGIMENLFSGTGWKRILQKTFSRPLVVRGVVLPLAKYLEHRRIISFLYALCHLYYFEWGLAESESPSTE
jgi:glycosyltransferase involved in cell wall biosynthesis